MSDPPTTLPSQTFPLILAAPSGTGKTTIAQRLRERRSDVVFSVSATTRPPRGNEMNGRDYLFVSVAEFQRMVDAGELLEWAEVHGHLYGTPRRNLEEAVERGHYLILDIDVQGARQILQAVSGAVAIFVLPPSGHALVERLARRASEDDVVRARRLSAAQRELGEAEDFDYVIVNDHLERSVQAVETIIAAEAMRGKRIPALADIVSRIQSEVGEYLHRQTPSGVVPVNRQETNE